MAWVSGLGYTSVGIGVGVGVGTGVGAGVGVTHVEYAQVPPSVRGSIEV